MRFPTLRIAVVAEALAGELAAQSPPPAEARIDSIFAQFTRPGSPGCAVGLSRDGQVELARGYGLANLESSAPITPNTVFNIGSTSKQFVAFATMLLASEGKLTLDDPVRRWVPELPDLGAPLTIRQLIHHTSGLRDYATMLGLMGWQQGDQYDARRLLALVGGWRDLNFPPGSRYLYSNTGYVLLATIVSRASGTSWADFAERRMFAPLGMSATEVRRDPFATTPARALAYAGIRDSGRYRLVMPNHDITGSTAVMTTVLDLAKWAGNASRPVVGDASLARRMEERGVLAGGDTIAYAGGLQIRRYRGVPLVEHSGGTGGYNAQLLRFPAQRAAVTVLCNLAGANAPTLAIRVADAWLADAFPEPAPGSEVARSGPAPEGALGLVGTYLDPITDAVFWVTVSRDTIFVSPGGSGRARAVPLGGDRFRLGGAVLSFTRDSEGRGTGALMTGGDGPGQRYERVVEPAPASASFSRFEGSFYSGELDRTWRILVRDGKLRLSRRDFPETELLPAFPDGFIGGGTTLRFVRDRGEVVGLLVSAGRALKVRFIRVAPTAP